VTPDPDVAIVYQVLYDTPRGTALLKVQSYTEGAAKRGIQCQLGHRKPGESEQRAAPLSLEEALQAEMRAAVLDGESIYLRLVDSQGRDLSATKIDEARWPREADPTTVKTVSYWLYAPKERLG
jgi:hypothetical protein